MSDNNRSAVFSRRCPPHRTVVPTHARTTPLGCTIWEVYFSTMNKGGWAALLPDTAWLPGTCQVGRLVRRPGGPPHQMLK